MFHFAAVLRAFAQSSGWDAALVLLRDMEHQSVQSNVIAQSCAITACEKGGKWVEAEQLTEIRKACLQQCRLRFFAGSC